MLMSTKDERTYEILNSKDLERLRDIVLKEQEDFFKRNPKFTGYRNRLIGICLCQGAAAHYIDKQAGIQDFDIWFFYKAEKDNLMWVRKRRSIKTAYLNKRIDFLKRAIPEELCNLENAGEIIKNYLLVSKQKTPKFLLEKAGIGYIQRPYLVKFCG